MSRSSARSQFGFTMVEVVVAMTVLAIVVPAITGLLNWSVAQAVKAREQARASRLAQMVTARTRTMDFFGIVVTSPTVHPTRFVDSDLPNFGLPATYNGGTYPGLAHLQQMLQEVIQQGFNRFTIDVTHMRRDKTNADPDKWNDLVPFEDTDGNLIDDNDPQVRYLDGNGGTADGDYFDAPGPPGAQVSEQPDTRIKQLTIRVYRKGTLFAQKSGELLSAEMFSGQPGVSAESMLPIAISAPKDNDIVYRNSGALAAARALTITAAYPTTVTSRWVNGDSSIAITGQTEATSRVEFYRGNTASLVDTLTNTGTSGVISHLSGNLVPASAGPYSIFARAFKAAFASPYARVDLFLDTAIPTIPPIALMPQPSATIRTLSPFVQAQLWDLGNPSAGLCPDVSAIFFNPSLGMGALNVEPSVVGSSVNFTMAWRDATTLLPVPLTDGSTYQLVAEGGDNAGYKVRRTWSFTVALAGGDSSGQVRFVPPAWNAGNVTFSVYDQQRGINFSQMTVVARLNGTGPDIPLFSPTTPQPGRFIKPYAIPEGGTVSIPASLPGGGSTYRIFITIQRWGYPTTYTFSANPPALTAPFDITVP